MSYTEIYKFNKQGDASLNGEVRNAWRGAMAVWEIIEKKYLTPLPKPDWMDQKIYDERGYTRCAVSPMNGKAHPLSEIWTLYDGDLLSEIDKIVLGTTFDNVVVKKEHFDNIIQAFNEFEGETNLKEQADIIIHLKTDESCIGIGWNQTSVNGDAWSIYNDEKEECEPYNLNTNNKHWFLFDKN